MNWEDQLRMAETLLLAPSIPPSEEIITAIKRVNPTRLCLPDAEKERGYEVKNRLQNALLENYGEAFKLVPHPCDDKVVLIKHLFLPSVDACHTRRDALSLKALDCVSDGEAATEGKGDKAKGIHSKRKPTGMEASPREALSRAQQLLDQYDYEAAERELAALQLTRSDDLAAFTRGIRLLLETIGAYRTAIDTLLAQGARMLQEKSVRELLGLAYYGHGSRIEAGAVFDSLHPSDLGKDALIAYARLVFEDGKLLFAKHLLRLAEAKEGFVDGCDGLKKEIEQALAAEAEPVLELAVAALARGELERARELAREVLGSGNALPKARRIVALAECCTVQAEVAVLWQSLERCSERKERMQVLQRLCDLDRRNESRIEQLMRTEHEAERREVIEQRSRTLHAAFIEERWPECFAQFRWLGRQQDADEYCREAVSLSPLFQVLYLNKRLERLTDHAAEDAWLSFVEAVSLRRAGRNCETLQILTQVRRLFGSFPYFRQEYAEALAAERHAAGDEARRLVAKALEEGVSSTEVTSIQGSLRRVAAHLAPDERANYLSAVERRLVELRPRRSDEDLLAEYEAVSWMGDTARAAALAEQITDAEAKSEVDREIAETLKIEVEPVALTISPELSVDVDREHPGALLYLTTDRHICIVTGTDCFTFIDMKEATAWRLRAPIFRKLLLNDYNSEKNLFLFRMGADGDCFVRFVLDGKQSRFTSVISIEDGVWGDHLEIHRVFLSSGKENEYFCVLKDSESCLVDRMVRFSINCPGNAAAVLPLNGEETKALERTRSEPDTFVVVTGAGASLCSRNLAWPRPLPFGECIYGINRQTGKVYFSYSYGLLACDLKTTPIDGFHNGLMAGLFWPQEVFGISHEAEKMFLHFKGERGTCYNLANNTLSTQFSLTTIVCTSTPSRFYYLEYDENVSWLRLKDITDELDTLLHWKEVVVAEEPKDSFVPKYEKLRDGVDLVREMLAAEQ